VRRHALFPARGLWKKSIMGDVTDHCPQWREYLCQTLEIWIAMNPEMALSRIAGLGLRACIYLTGERSRRGGDGRRKHETFGIPEASEPKPDARASFVS
jgi:hypothetical protein